MNGSSIYVIAPWRTISSSQQRNPKQNPFYQPFPLFLLR